MLPREDPPYIKRNNARIRSLGLMSALEEEEEEENPLIAQLPPFFIDEDKVDEVSSVNLNDKDNVTAVEGIHIPALEDEKFLVVTAVEVLEDEEEEEKSLVITTVEDSQSNDCEGWYFDDNESSKSSTSSTFVYEELTEDESTKEE